MNEMYDCSGRFDRFGGSCAAGEKNKSDQSTAEQSGKCANILFPVHLLR